MEPIRINKYIANAGICSRRDADKLIDAGRIKVNGVIANRGIKLTGEESVLFDDKPITMSNEKVIIAVNKPMGYVVSEKDEHAEKLIYDIIDYPKRLTYCGRLDKDSEGLILLTNDGDFINCAMKASNYHEKEYIVQLNRSIVDEDIVTLRKGIYLDDLSVKTRSCRIEKLNKNTVSMTITQGLNRQIRRMWAALGYEVISLKRIRVINIWLGDLEPGQWRVVEGKELRELYAMVGLKL